MLYLNIMLNDGIWRGIATMTVDYQDTAKTLGDESFADVPHRAHVRDRT
jgi:hypothetical protein